MHTKCDVVHSIHSMHRVIPKGDVGHTSYTWHRCCYVRMHAFYSYVGSDELMPFGSMLMLYRYLHNTIMLVIFIRQGKKGTHTRGFVM